jgi:photosystem II stability/assembly factor-like uncharacterized protein
MRRAALLALLLPVAAAAQVGPPSALLGELRWRGIGPLRGGRTKAAVGVPTRPGTFFIGACNGGVWRTSDYGRTWQPIFDDQPTGSIGAIAVAPSNPDIIYVGSGEGLQRPDLSTGDGIYRSADGGQTWAHLGLRDAQQIPQIAVDPHDPDRLFVAALGHPYGPSDERGIFRSTDGGKSFQRVLFRDADTGGADVVLDPSDARVVYAVLWEAREGPWENGAFKGPGSGLWKSSDGGDTWQPLTRGLPDAAQGLGRIGVTVAPSAPRRLYATVEAKGEAEGLYRSDDAGQSWARLPADARVVERADDFAEVKVDPKNPDIVYTASIVAWRSTDGGHSFSALRGAPGGDDYHRLWIDPGRPDTILLAGDQGALITVNGGATWSSWYNQPTAQMFHVTADHAFPYRLCGGQQESGSACVASRGDGGQILASDWQTVGFEEYGYAAPDPLDPDVVYGGKVSRWDRRTGQTAHVGPRLAADDRVVRTQPLSFSPTDPHTLYATTSRVWRTNDGGQSWTAISPDLSRPTWTVPSNVGKYAGSAQARPRRRGVVYALAPSPKDGRILWAGTDDGLIHLTRDGGRTWADVTPPGLAAWSKIAQLEAGHFDAGTAYAAVNTLRLDELAPHVLVTHDFGKSWRDVGAGLPGGAVVNVVREDPVRRGLLYAGSETTVHVSFDDGAAWQPLRLNLPATSIRDLIVKDADLAVATHGRGFWILDDVTPLRALDAAALARPLFLVPPAPAWRVRFDTNTDTPAPPDEPRADNPPDGAVLDYRLAADAHLVTLELVDARGLVVRRFASDAPPATAPRDEGNWPRWWQRPEPALSARAGLHRFVWDLHGETPRAGKTSFPIAAVPGRTAREPRGPFVLPGRYTVRLTVDGASVSAPLEVRQDPRVTTPLAALTRRHALAERLATAMTRTQDLIAAARALGPRGAALVGADAADDDGDDEETGGRPSSPSLAPLAQALLRLYQRVEEADAPAPAALVAAVDEALATLAGLERGFNSLK